MHESSYCIIYPFLESEDDTVITSNAIKRRPTSSQWTKRKIVNYAEEMHRAKMAFLQEEHEMKMKILRQELSTKELEHQLRATEFKVISRFSNSNDECHPSSDIV